MASQRDGRPIYVMTPGWMLLRGYVIACGIAALIGLLIGVVWVIAGILHFHLFW